MEKKEFIEQINKAFASCDMDFLMESVTKDFQWKIAGEDPPKGIDKFKETLKKMKDNGPMSIDIHEIILDKNRAVVEGTVQLKKPGKKRRYAFCDVYVLKEDKEKVKELRTYITPIKRK